MAKARQAQAAARKTMDFGRNLQFADWFRAAVAGTAMLLAATLPAAAASELTSGSSSGLPVPRFVSLKPDKVNVRAGPTRDHDVTWQYTRAGLPVEITAESDNWRRIRDWEGSEGWVYHSLLSGRRTAIVISKAKDALVPLYVEPDTATRLSAQLQPGVMAQVKRCGGKWCQIAGSGFSGWIAQERLWGVYPNETLP
jgi:SH3-like domain-containing protein